MEMCLDCVRAENCPFLRSFIVLWLCCRMNMEERKRISIAHNHEQKLRNNELSISVVHSSPSKVKNWMSLYRQQNSYSWTCKKLNSNRNYSKKLFETREREREREWVIQQTLYIFLGCFEYRFDIPIQNITSHQEEAKQNKNMLNKKLQ